MVQRNMPIGVIFLLIIHFCVAAYDGCPCEDKRWCAPILGIPAHEVPVFIVSKTNWIKYDWNRITSAIQFNSVDHNVTCYAHSKGARSIFTANFPAANLTNSHDRSRWVSEQISIAKQYFQDGINVDFKDEIDRNNTARRRALTMLYVELAVAFRQTFKDPQISFDVAWSPDCIDSRCYDYRMLAAVSDYIFVMAYDERSQITGDCVAFANSAYNTTIHGVERYISLGISPEKIVLGVPWYGYVYPCIKVDENLTCTIKKVPFRGVGCSDAAGRQHDYSNIVNVKFHQAVSKIKWHPIAKSPYFLAKDPQSTQVEEIWFDNPESLTYKYKYAASRKLRGVGVWNADCLDYTDTSEGKKQRQEMWGAIPFINGSATVELNNEILN